MSWVSSKIYAGTTAVSVAPGALSNFSYAVKVPAGTPPGDYYFTGDLLLRVTGAPLHPVGYLQIVRVVP